MKTGFPILVLILIQIFSSCKLLNEKHNQKNPATINISPDSTGMSMYMNISPIYDTSILKFDTITKETFAKYKKNYHPKINPDTTKIGWTDTSFLVKTFDSTYIFPANQNDYSHFAYYDGFLTPLNLYIVTYVDGNNEVGDLLLIDSKTNKQYELGSNFDDPCEPPLISTKNNFLVAISNDEYEDNACSFSLVKINRNNSSFAYQSILNYSGNEWKINELVWISENSFALHIVTSTRNEETNEVTETENYLRVSFDLRNPATNHNSDTTPD